MGFSNSVKIVSGQRELASWGNVSLCVMEAFEERVSPLLLASIAIHCLLTDGASKAQPSLSGPGRSVLGNLVQVASDMKVI